jgi:hypothetical protein
MVVQNVVEHVLVMDVNVVLPIRVPIILHFMIMVIGLSMIQMVKILQQFVHHVVV